MIVKLKSDRIVDYKKYFCDYNFNGIYNADDLILDMTNLLEGYSVYVERCGVWGYVSRHGYEIGDYDMFNIVKE